MKLRILSMNIGNPSLERAQRQYEWLKGNDYDVLVLTETRNSAGCSYIEQQFIDDGMNVFFPKSQSKELGVMLVSKYALEDRKSIFDEDNPLYTRYAEAKIQAGGRKICLIGLYVPSRDRSEAKINRKRTFIDAVTEKFVHNHNGDYIITGDLNILDRKHEPHYNTFYKWEYDFYDDILSSGFTDAFRCINGGKQDYSWVGRTGDGYRYDYCFVSDQLKPSLRVCKFIHKIHELKLTDHSAIETIIEL